MGGGVSSLSACECSPSKRSAVAGSLAAWAAERARWHAPPAWCSWLPLPSVMDRQNIVSAGSLCTATIEAVAALSAVMNPQTPHWTWHSGARGTHNTLASSFAHVVVDTENSGTT